MISSTAILKKRCASILTFAGNSSWTVVSDRPDDARRTAHLKFGNTTRIKEKSQMTWGSELLESFVQDLTYGARALLRSPALTIVALISLALGVGANHNVQSLVDAVLWMARWSTSATEL